MGTGKHKQRMQITTPTKKANLGDALLNGTERQVVIVRVVLAGLLVLRGTRRQVVVAHVRHFHHALVVARPQLSWRLPAFALWLGVEWQGGVSEVWGDNANKEKKKDSQ